METNSKKKTEGGKKVGLLVLVALDVIVTIFLLVIAIIMLVETVNKTPEEIKAATGFIGYLQNHTTFYFCLFVLPLFLLLAADIVGLVFFVRKSTKDEPVEMKDLSEEQKAALKKQLLADMMKSQAEEEKKDTSTPVTKEETKPTEEKGENPSSTEENK
ncbi:MAG: hypothetical protein PUA93_05950 [Eubacteriales bacterium]|nr:hypothetical protein [Eubacteriales bacterium]